MQPAPERRSGRACRAGAAAVLVGLGVTAWANSFSVPFIWDDKVMIVDNPGIRRLWPLRDAFISPPHHGLNARPVTSLSLALDYAAGGLDVRTYHAVNLGLHTLSALVLMGLVRRTLAGPRLGPRFGDAAAPLGFVVAAIWLAHPLQTESVTYMSQRAELLMGLFYLLTLWAAARAWDGPRPGLWYAGGVLACALGMASKEVAVSAPVMVVLYDRLFVCASLRETFTRRRAFYAALGATWVVPVVLLGAAPYEVIGLGRGMTPWEYALTQLGIIVQYLRLSVWPDALCLDHGTWVARAPGEILPPALVIGALAAGTGWALVRGHPLGFLGAWFFLILAPSSSVVPIPLEVMAERRMHLPLAAVVVLGVTLGHLAAERLRRARRGSARLGRVAGAALVVAVVGTLGVLTVRRNHDYRSELAIWTDTVRKRPENPRARSELGTVLLARGEPDAAIVQYTEALRIDPGFAEARLNLGVALLAQGRLDEAIARYRETLEAAPDLAAAHYNLASALFARGETEGAAAHVAAFLRLEPDKARAHGEIGAVLLNLGRVDEAVAHYAAALRIAPESADLRERLREARALLSAGEVPAP